MAYTAHKNPSEVQEFFDSQENLNKNASRVAELIRTSKHITVFTGAGISTLCGIPDFRGPKGVWTLAAAGEERVGKVTSATKAIPSYTHMALVQLQALNRLKYVISQNCDGLHRKSGILSSNISELHGNRNLEKCATCNKEYLRDYDATASYIFDVHDHRTGRKCVCGGDLLDSIINFGDNLDDTILSKAWTHTKNSDLMIVIGSSLTVKPACLMPELVGKDPAKKLVILNLQKTPYDDIADVRVHAHSDDFFKLVMQNLNIEVPPFLLKRYCCINISRQANEAHIFALDTDGTTASIFPGIIANSMELDSEPFIYKIKPDTKELEVKLFFFGHYNEPPVTLKAPTSTTNYYFFTMIYNPMTAQWTIQENLDFQLPPTYPLPPPLPSEAVKSKAKTVGFSVEPKTDCPHINNKVSIGVASQIGAAFKSNICYSCKDSSENWICLMCGATACSRYVQGHAKEHAEQTGHPIVLSFSDLSVWCYDCFDYIKDPFLTTMFVGELHKQKFS